MAKRTNFAVLVGAILYPITGWQNPEVQTRWFVNRDVGSWFRYLCCSALECKPHSDIPNLNAALNTHGPMRKKSQVDAKTTWRFRS